MLIDSTEMPFHIDNEWYGQKFYTKNDIHSYTHKCEYMQTWTFTRSDQF